MWWERKKWLKKNRIPLKWNSFVLGLHDSKKFPYGIFPSPRQAKLPLALSLSTPNSSYNYVKKNAVAFSELIWLI